MANVNKVTNDDVLAATVKIEDKISWSDLESTYADISKHIIELQYMIMSIVTPNIKMIEADSKLHDIVKGMLLSVEDTAGELAVTREKYIQNLTGGNDIISEDDEDGTMKYLSISAEFIACGEKVSILMSTAVTDILISLNIDDGLIKDAVELQNNIIKGVTNE